MTIEKLVADRGITEVVHYTTSTGLLGILDAGFVRARTRLKKDQRLEHILCLNTPIVKDQKWIDYVNLSITQINQSLFTYSSTHWHPDSLWCILSFDPKILGHEGVFFATCNNTHPSVHRGKGVVGLEALFARCVRWGYYGSENIRSEQMPDNLTTSSEAEVLYPVELSLEFLQRVYVPTADEQDNVAGYFLGLDLRMRDVAVVVDKNRFGGGLS